MTRIKNKNRIPLVVPKLDDYFVGSQQDNNGKTVNFDFNSVINTINEANGFSTISYKFSVDEDATTEEGYFNTNGDEVSFASITQILINDVDFSGSDLSSLLGNVTDNKENVVLYLKDPSTQSLYFYFKVTAATNESGYYNLTVERLNTLSIGNLTDDSTYTLGFIAVPQSSNADWGEGDSNNPTFILNKPTNTSDFTNDGEGSDRFVEDQELGDVAFSNDYEDLDNKPVFKVVENEYANMAALYADQGSQTSTFIQYVLDASGHLDVTSGAKYFEYLGTTVGDNTDYRILSEGESAPISGSISKTSDIPLNDGEDGSSRYIEEDELGLVAVTDDYEDLLNKPQNLSDFTDDIGATDAILPLSAFLDSINGDDSIAELENSERKFKTFESMYNAIPSGSTYTVYLYSDVNVEYQFTPDKNLIFKSAINVSLDFSNIKTDLEVAASYVLSPVNSNFGTWTFEGNNISIISDYIGSRVFSSSGSSRLTLKGSINNLDWKSSQITNQSGLFVCPNIDLLVQNGYDSEGSGKLLTANGYIEFENFTVRNNQGLTRTSPDLEIKVNNIIDATGGGGSWNWSTNGATKKVTIGDISYDGSIFFKTQDLTIDGTLSATTKIDIFDTFKISGTLRGDGFVETNNLVSGILFENFTGLIKGIMLTNNSANIIFRGCNVTLSSFLYQNFGDSNTETAVFEGFNTIFQQDTNERFIRAYGNGAISDPRPTNIVIKGTLKTNAKTYGKDVSYTTPLSTFKEKSKEIVIRDRVSIVNLTLDHDLTYLIDGTIELLSGEYIEVPAGGNLTINGYGLESSGIIKNVVGESIFTSPLGGSGGLQLQGLSISSGLGSVFDIEDEDGTNAIEVNVANFDGCASIGEITGYRQFLGTTIGIYGCSDGFTLSGSWSGFKMTNTNIFGFGSSGTLFKEGTTLTFSSRFFAELNASFPTGAILSDFVTGNFNSDKLFQLKDGQYSLNGTSVDTNTTSLIPNITEKDSKTLWEQNVGLSDSYKPFARVKGEDGLYYEIYVDASGVLQTRTV